MSVQSECSTIEPRLWGNGQGETNCTDRCETPAPSRRRPATHSPISPSHTRGPERVPVHTGHVFSKSCNTHDPRSFLTFTQRHHHRREPPTRNPARPSLILLRVHRQSRNCTRIPADPHITTCRRHRILLRRRHRQGRSHTRRAKLPALNNGTLLAGTG